MVWWANLIPEFPFKVAATVNLLTNLIKQKANKKLRDEFENGGAFSEQDT